MNADETVKRLREYASRCDGTHSCWHAPTLDVAAAMIESLQAQLAESQRREQAAVEDMKVMALAMRESDELSEGCCFACVCDGQNLPGNVILPYGECPGYDTNDCFEWRGPQEARKGE